MLTAGSRPAISPCSSRPACQPVSSSGTHPAAASETAGWPASPIPCSQPAVTRSRPAIPPCSPAATHRSSSARFSLGLSTRPYGRSRNLGGGRETDGGRGTKAPARCGVDETRRAARADAAAAQAAAGAHEVVNRAGRGASLCRHGVRVRCCGSARRGAA